MNEELKPCPFCGGRDVYVSDAGFNHFAVRCRNKGCEGQGKRDYEKTSAILAWNTREVSDKLERALKEIAKTSKAEDSCFYKNIDSINTANRVLAEVASLRATHTSGEQA